MREILFRAKGKHDGIWKYGLFRIDKTGLFDKPIIEIETSIESKNSGKRVPTGKKFIVLENTIGQYTGMLDENRRRIYEGDIVKIIMYNNIMTFNDFLSHNNNVNDYSRETFCSIYKQCFGKIIFKHGCWEVQTEYSEDKPEILYNILNSNKVRLFVIGNIHDNPDFFDSHTLT